MLFQWHKTLVNFFAHFVASYPLRKYNLELFCLLCVLFIKAMKNSGRSNGRLFDRSYDLVFGPGLNEYRAFKLKILNVKFSVLKLTMAKG